MIFERIHQGETAEQIGITQELYDARQKAVNRWLEGGNDWNIQNFLKWHREEHQPAPTSALLGERIETGLKAVGIHQAVKAFSAATGIDCGCTKRKSVINDWDRKRKERKRQA